MLRRRAVVTTLVLLVLGLSRGIAEASRYDFEGGGNFEAIIWDGDFDVSTMQNQCGISQACDTSAFQSGILPRFFLSGGLGATTTFNALTLVLSMPAAELPLNCGGFVCGALDAIFPPGLNLSESNLHHNVPPPPAGQGAQAVLLLPAVLPNGPGGEVHAGDIFDLTQNAGNFLLGLSPVGPWHMGIVTAFNQFGDQHSTFYLNVVQTPRVNAVPEPATLALLGTGIATLVARRRRARR